MDDMKYYFEKQYDRLYFKKYTTTNHARAS